MVNAKNPFEFEYLQIDPFLGRAERSPCSATVAPGTTMPHVLVTPGTFTMQHAALHFFGHTLATAASVAHTKTEKNNILISNIAIMKPNFFIMESPGMIFKMLR